MKRLLFFALICALFSGCKTTEANYRAAYEVAREARDAKASEDDGLDPETRAMLARQKQRGVSRQIVGSDTLSVTTLFVKMTSGEPDRVPRYSVAVNSFSQKFNAQAMMQRLRENGYPGAYVFETGTPDYYVATAGSDSIEALPLLLEQSQRAADKGMRSGFPKIIQSGGYRK